MGTKRVLSKTVLIFKGSGSRPEFEPSLLLVPDLP